MAGNEEAYSYVMELLYDRPNWNLPLLNRLLVGAGKFREIYAMKGEGDQGSRSLDRHSDTNLSKENFFKSLPSPISGMKKQKRTGRKRDSILKTSCGRN